MRALLGLGGLAAAVAEATAPVPLPDPARDEAILAMLPLVPLSGWTQRTARAAAGEAADLLFPGGPPEMVEAHSDLADRMMADEAGRLGEERVSRRVRALLLVRLRRWDDHRDAVRRGLAVLSLPPYRPVAVRVLARTADAVWRAAGDDASGFSRYSKRALLGAVYAPTLLFWLQRGSGPDTEAFLDRRLASVARLGRLRARFGR